MCNKFSVIIDSSVTVLPDCTFITTSYFLKTIVLYNQIVLYLFHTYFHWVQFYNAYIFLRYLWLVFNNILCINKHALYNINRAKSRHFSLFKNKWTYFFVELGTLFITRWWQHRSITITSYLWAESMEEISHQSKTEVRACVADSLSVRGFLFRLQGWRCFGIISMLSIYMLGS